MFSKSNKKISIHYGSKRSLSRLTVNVFGWAHRGLVVVFLCSGFRSPLDPLLCFITVFVIICFIVMYDS